MSEGISLRALAKRLGVSAGTVSKALSGAGGISAATSIRIRAAAAAAGWRRDPLLSLQGTVRRHGNTMRLLAVVSGRQRPGRTERLVTGLSPDAARLGYRLHLLEPVPDLAQRVRELGVCGVLVDGPRSDLDIDWGRQPGVQIGGTHSLPIPRVGPDPFAAVQRCIAEVRTAGWRRIGCLICTQSPPLDDDRRRHAAVLECDTGIPAFLGLASNRTAIRTWLRRQRPEAVIGFNHGHLALMPTGMPFAALHVDPAKNPDCSGLIADSLGTGIHALRFLDLQIRHRDLAMGGDWMLITGRQLWNPGKTLIRRG